MSVPNNRISIAVHSIDLLLLTELAGITGQPLSAVASRAVSEWIVEHYEKRRTFYVDALNRGTKGIDANSISTSKDQTQA